MERIILFDGVCNFCDASVQFMIKRDPSGKFKYTPLQSEVGQKILAENRLSAAEFDSIILSENGKIYKKSTAALRIAKELSGLWPFLYLFIIVPPFIRNAVYDFVAANRYKWYGKKEACMVPSPEVRSRFI